MKKPSKNISASLRAQSPVARGGLEMNVSKVTGAKPSMTIPGQGGVERPPGMVQDRSAARYTDPMSRYGGK